MNLTPHVYATPEEKRRDRIIGFVGWYIVNGVFVGLYILVAPLLAPLSNGPLLQRTVVEGATIIGALLPWVINLAGLIYFGSTRSQIALGGLLAIAVLFLIAVVAACLFVAYCFVNLRNL